MSRTHVFFLQLDTECGVGNDTADALCLLLYTTCIAVWHAALRPYIYITGMFAVASPNRWAGAAVTTEASIRPAPPPNRQNVLHVLRHLPSDPRLHSHTTSTN